MAWCPNPAVSKCARCPVLLCQKHTRVIWCRLCFGPLETEWTLIPEPDDEHRALDPSDSDLEFEYVGQPAQTPDDKVLQEID